MKITSAYIILLSWISYLVAVLPLFQVQHSNAIMAHTVTTTHSPVQDEPSACCEKMHHNSNTSPNDQCTTHEHQSEKDCCTSSGCAMVCCNVIIAGIVPQVNEDAIDHIQFPIDIHFHTLPAQHLPSPFIGIDFPPPNC